jgi:hypothetical protein
MTLIKETGSVVENANTYVDLDDVRTYATARGITVSTDDVTLEQQIIQAMDYVESKRDLLKGIKSVSTQTTQFPRIGVSVDGHEIASDYIPDDWKNAQCQVVIEITNGIDLTPTVTERPIIRDTTGPLTTVYSDKWGSFSQPFMPKVESFLKPFYKSNGIVSFYRR